MKGPYYKDKPNLMLVSNLLLPLLAIQDEIKEIVSEYRIASSQTMRNGLFIMLVSRLETTVREVLVYFLTNNSTKAEEKFLAKELKVSRDALSEGEGFRFVERIMSGYLELLSFQDLGDLFFRVLHIKKPSNLIDIIEMKTVRNRIVHDRFDIDYKHNQVVLGRTSMNLINFERWASATSVFLEGVATDISSKYSKYTRLRLFIDLWKFTFNTPLCANIEDYWTLDHQADRVIAINIPKQEGGLSSSEKFLLDMWRGQFSQRDVKFLNMSSLDRHSQLCLYLFLKVSNDVFMY